MRRRSRVLTVCVATLLIGGAWLALLAIRDGMAESRAVATVSELGGRMSSIKFWPLAAEYRVTFRGVRPRKGEFQRLTVLNALAERYWVGIAFVDTTMTRDDVLALRQLLPRCVVFRIVDGQMLKD